MKYKDLTDWITFKTLGLGGYFLYYFRLCFYKLPKYIFYKIQGRHIMHFVHIPKTGGTAVKYALRGALDESSSVIVLHPHLINLSHIPFNDKVFFFVRDPITRFVSAFNMRKELLATMDRRFFSKSEIQILEGFSSVNELAEALTSPIMHRMDLAKKAFRSMFFVSNGLSELLISSEYLLRRIDSIVFIGRQEHLEEDFRQLKDLIGLPDGLSLPSDPLLANKSLGSLPISLSEVAKRNLNEILSKDYEILHTCDQIRKQMKSGIIKGETRSD